MARRLKVVVLGSIASGKTYTLVALTKNQSFAESFLKQRMPLEHDLAWCPGPGPGGIEPEEVVVPIEFYELNGEPTSSFEDGTRLRPLSYPGTHVFLITFSVNDSVSLMDVKNFWIPDVQRHLQNVPSNSRLVVLATRAPTRYGDVLSTEAIQTFERFARQHGISFICDDDEEAALTQLEETFGEVWRGLNDVPKGARKGCAVQ